MTTTTWYRGSSEAWSGEDPPELPAPAVERFTDPQGYLADEGLVDAVNVALRLGQPLLLTGQPGTGKTQLAYSLARELGCGDPLKFETKSTSIARDLFYTYDALGRFNAREIEKDRPILTLDYIEWNALGLAILRTRKPAEVADLLGKKVHPKPRRSLVLIDEVDKAPRDFPNDLLNEIEHMYFRIPELRNREVKADPALRPVTVLTSNSEKNLAEAFLRRCAFYYIPFPEPKRLKEIIRSRFGKALGDEELLASAVDLIDKLRASDLALLKTPSTGELLGWLQDLIARPEQDVARLTERTLCALIKTVDDRPRAKKVVEEWVKSRPKSTV